MSTLHDAASRRKRLKRPPSNIYRAPAPGFSRVATPVDSSQASRSIYDGQHRLGSYRNCAGRWVAVDRLNRPIGSFDTEAEARLAIYGSGQ
jgi:hypothetical protein